MYLLILCCFARAFSSCYKRRLLFLAVLLTMAVSLVQHGLQAPRLRSWRRGFAAPWHVGSSWTRINLYPCTGGHVLTTETFTGSSNAPAPPGGGRAPPATSAGALPASQGVRATSDSTPAGSRPPPLEQPPENLLHRPLMGRRCTGRLTGNTSRGLRPKGSHLQQGYDGRFRKRPCHCWLRCSIVSRSIRVQSSPFRIGVQRASLCSRARISAGVSRVSLAACTASGNLAAEAGARQQRGGLGREGR